MYIGSCYNGVSCFIRTERAVRDAFLINETRAISAGHVLGDARERQLHPHSVAVSSDRRNDRSRDHVLDHVARIRIHSSRVYF